MRLYRLLRATSAALAVFQGAGRRDAGVVADPQSDWDLLRDPYQAHLEHQIRLWTAEEENSRRLGQRVGLLITASFGFFGVVLLRFGLASFVIPPVEGWAIWLLWSALVFLVAGLMCLAVGCLFLFDVVSRRKKPLDGGDAKNGADAVDKQPTEGDARRPSSLLLQLPEDDIEGFKARLEYLITDESAGHREYSRLSKEQLYIQANRYYGAVEELRIRNAEEKTRIDEGQRWFLFGVGGTMLALLCWACANVKYATYDQAVANPTIEIVAGATDTDRGDDEHGASTVAREEAAELGTDEPRGTPPVDPGDSRSDEGVGDGQ